jgi:hypothetical protein
MSAGIASGKRNENTRKNVASAGRNAREKRCQLIGTNKKELPTTDRPAQCPMPESVLPMKIALQYAKKRDGCTMALFSRSKRKFRITITGTVVELQLINPHSQIIFEVKGGG